MWCEVRDREIRDYRTCDEYITISFWWANKIAGNRDIDEDEDFNENDFEED